jgi:hypothetical protein
LCWMVTLSYRKIEYRHDGITDCFVQQSIMLPDRLCSFVVESIQSRTHPIGSQ